MVQTPFFVPAVSVVVDVVVCLRLSEVELRRMLFLVFKCYAVGIDEPRLGRRAQCHLYVFISALKHVDQRKLSYSQVGRKGKRRDQEASRNLRLTVLCMKLLKYMTEGSTEQTLDKGFPIPRHRSKSWPRKSSQGVEIKVVESLIDIPRYPCDKHKDSDGRRSLLDVVIHVRCCCPLLLGLWLYVYK